MWTWIAAPATAIHLTWTENDKPKIELQPVEVQDDLDLDRFYKMFVDLLIAPTPKN